MHKWLTCILILFSFITIKAENRDTANTRLPVSGSLMNIANSMSVNTDNDSQRVANIFYWVAHNIAWDTKSFNKEEKLKFRHSKDVLKSKTATPREYAQLIKDLCELTGIKAMVIPGYEKNELYEDGAGFYNPNHVWNAVLVGNRWLLVDVCNGAGGQYMDLSWWKKKMQKMHKKKLYTSTKVKFKYEYKPEYLFQDPEEVRLTRVPVDPIWQLTDTVMPISIFEKSESDIREFNEKYSRPKQYAITLSEVYNLSDNEYTLECADRTYAYNPRYTAMKASKHIAQANEKIKKVNKAKDKTEAAEIVKMTKTELDTAKSILSEQKKEISEEYTLLRKVNNEKRTDVTRYKQTFTSANRKHLATITSKQNNASSKSKSLGDDSRAKAKRINDIKVGNYAKSKVIAPEKKDNDPVVLKLKDSIMSRNSRMSILKEEINVYKNRIASDKEDKSRIIDSLNVYIKLSDSAFYKEAVARSKKQDSFDDSIRTLRSKLYYYKADRLDGFQNLYFEKYDSITSAYDIIKKEYAYIIDASKKNTKDIEALKKMVSNDNMENSYYSNADEYKDAIRGYINNNLGTTNFLKSEVKTLGQMQNLYTKQNDYFDFLINNEDNRKEYVNKMLDKSESIDKKHNEQRKEMLNDYKDDLDKEFTKVKKRKKK